MSDHLVKHRAEMERQAHPVVAHFVKAHPAYSIDPDQSGSQSVTNYVIFGHRGAQPVVFKYFCEDERRAREVYSLNHFAETGIVPQLLEDDQQRLIVVARIPGAFLPGPEGDTDAFRAIDTTRVGYTLGQATAQLMNVPMNTQAAQDFESRFYDGLRLPEYFQGILQAAWSIHRTVDCYKGSVFAQALECIEENLDYILAQKRLLYHQDAMNMHFADSHFTGFFDLEMCRVGTEAMQIGSLWWIFAVFKAWEPFVQGYAATTQRELGPQDFAAGRAFAHFMVWRYISRYGRWHGDSLDAAQMAEEKVNAAEYARSIELNNSVGNER